jgi:hypothetical protein
MALSELALFMTTRFYPSRDHFTSPHPNKAPVDKVIADGASYSIERTEAFSRAGVTPVIPPAAHAVVHGDEDTRWHDQSVKYIQDKGIYAFPQKVWLRSARASRGANLAYQAMHWRDPADAEDRLAAERRRHQR